MKHNPNASPGEGQSDGPRPQLLSPLGTLLPGLGPRPSFLSSWPLSWGCSIGKGPTGGRFCDPSSRMGAAPTQGQLLFHSQTPHTRDITTNLTVRPLLSHTRLSHTTLIYRSLIHHSHIPLSHTALTHDSHTHTALTYTALTHRSHILLSQTHHFHIHHSHIMTTALTL